MPLSVVNAGKKGFPLFFLPAGQCSGLYPNRMSNKNFIERKRNKTGMFLEDV